MQPLNAREYERLAAERLQGGVLAFYAGGALDEVTLAENEAAFLRRRLRPRVLVDVSAIDTSTTLLGTPLAMPIGVAPTAQHAYAHPEAECATAAACAQAGALLCASMMSSRTLEEIGRSSGPRWFQLYVMRDRELTRSLVQRAAAAGYTALV